MNGYDGCFGWGFVGKDVDRCNWVGGLCLGNRGEGSLKLNVRNFKGL